MTSYNSKPITVDAIQWLGTNYDEAKLFMNDRVAISADGQTLVIAGRKADINDWIIRFVGAEITGQPMRSRFFVMSDREFRSRFIVP